MKNRLSSLINFRGSITDSNDGFRIYGKFYMKSTTAEIHSIFSTLIQNEKLHLE